MSCYRFNSRCFSIWFADCCALAWCCPAVCLWIACHCTLTSLATVLSSRTVTLCEWNCEEHPPPVHRVSAWYCLDSSVGPAGKFKPCWGWRLWPLDSSFNLRLERTAWIFKSVWCGVQRVPLTMDISYPQVKRWFSQPTSKQAWGSSIPWTESKLWRAGGILPGPIQLRDCASCTGLCVELRCSFSLEGLKGVQLMGTTRTIKP